MRVSRSLKDTAYKAIYARDSLTRKNLKEPSMEEIATEIGISKEDIAYALDAIQNPMSLYEPIVTDGGDVLQPVHAQQAQGELRRLPCAA